MAVIDASIVVAALSPDEQDENALSTIAPFFRGGGFAPGLWSLEIANVLLTKCRRGVLTLADGDQVWRIIARMPIDEHHFETGQVAAKIRPLAVKHGLTSYDACYLQLALDKAVPLATADRRLAAAARSEGLQLL